MNINIKTTNVMSSDALTEYVHKRLEKIGKIVGDDPSAHCDVELARTTGHHNKGDIFKAEIHLVGAGKNIYASSEKEDLYIAIDDVQNDVMRELTAHKEKQISLVRRGGTRVKAMMKGLWPWKK